MPYNVAANLRVAMPDPIGVDQLKRKNALADMAAQTDQNRNALYAQQLSQNDARMKADEQAAMLEQVRAWAPGAYERVLANPAEAPAFVAQAQKLGITAPDFDVTKATPADVEQIAMHLGLAKPKAAAPIKLGRQGGFSYLEQGGNVIPGSVDKPQTVAPTAPVKPNWEKVEVIRGGKPVVGFIDKNSQNPEATFRSVGDAPRATAPSKPLPAPALKLVDDAGTSISVSRETLSLVDRAIAKLSPKEDGAPPEAQLGPMKNLGSALANKSGYSTPGSRAFADVKQTLEKLRNNYLLLAKGVQTEGDAARAWNSEIGENVENDNALAVQQLEKAKALTQQAIAAQEARIARVYANFGQSVPSKKRVKVDAQGNVIGN